MAISANTVWECRPDGFDVNGGGFVSDATGADYSQQAAAQYSGTNLTVSATTNTDVTPDGHTPVAADVGNLVHVTAGTGFTQKFYQIVSIQSGKWRLDAAPAATNTTGGTWAMGGAMKSPALVLRSTLAVVDGNIVWLRGGVDPRLTPFDITVNSNTVAGGKVSVTGLRLGISGYGTVRGDHQRAIIRNAVNTTSNPFSAGSGGYCQDIEFYGNKANFTASAGIAITLTVINCVFHNWSTVGFSSGLLLIGCHAHHNGTSGFTSGHFINCFSANNGSSGFRDGLSMNCVAVGNGNCGWINTSGTFGAKNCIAYGNTNSGFQYLTTPTQGNNFCMNCISYGNTTYGWGLGDYQNVLFNCAYGANGLAPFQSTTLTQYNMTALTANPFNNPTFNDFSLNTVSGGGLGLVGAGYSQMPMIDSIRNWQDIGAFQALADQVSEISGRSNPIFGLTP